MKDLQKTVRLVSERQETTESEAKVRAKASEQEEEKRQAAQISAKPPAQQAKVSNCISLYGNDKQFDCLSTSLGVQERVAAVQNMPERMFLALHCQWHMHWGPANWSSWKKGWLHL